MALLYSFQILLLVVFLSLATADIRTRRSPQFSQASASAGAFGNYPRGFGGQNFGPPRPPVFGPPGFESRGFGNPGFGNPGFGNPGFGNPGFGNPGFGNSGYGNPGFGNPGFGNPRFGGSGFGNPGFGNPGFGRPGSGGSINISKSVSISTGGRGGGARSSAGGFRK